MTAVEATQELPPPVRFELTSDDYFAMTAHFSSPRHLQPLPWPLMLFMCIGSTVIVAAVFPGHGVAFLMGICVGVAAYFVYYEQINRRAKRVFVPRPNGMFFHPRVITLSADGVKVTTSHSTSEVRWSAVIAVEDTARYIVVQFDTISGYLVPKSAFETAEAAARFAAFASNHAGVRESP